MGKLFYTFYKKNECEKYFNGCKEKNNLIGKVFRLLCVVPFITTYIISIIQMYVTSLYLIVA